MAEEAELLAPKLALGTLGVELPAAEDLEHLRDVEQVLFQRRGVHQATIHVNEPAPAQGARGPRDPAMDGRKARAWGWGRGTSGRAALKVETNGEGLVDDAGSSEDTPCRPNGTTWPSCDRKLVFHRSAARNRGW